MREAQDYENNNGSRDNGFDDGAPPPIAITKPIPKIRIESLRVPIGEFEGFVVVAHFFFAFGP
jgi:hypothetical protein